MVEKVFECGGQIQKRLNSNELSEGVWFVASNAVCFDNLGVLINCEATIGFTYLGRVMKNNSEVYTLICI